MVAVVLYIVLQFRGSGVNSCTNGLDRHNMHSFNAAGFQTVQIRLLLFASNLFKSLPQLVVQQVDVWTHCWLFAHCDETWSVFGNTVLHSLSCALMLNLAENVNFDFQKEYH